MTDTNKSSANPITIPAAVVSPVDITGSYPESVEPQNMSSVKNPDSITILINTRVRGYPKLKYEPKMSVPGIKSDTVYFDPVIKLNQRIASTVPKGYPPSELFTQFYDKGGFESLIGRTISKSWLGQKHKTLEQAKNDGYIDNNIDVTLKQLFKPKNIFYIKNDPYTIHNYGWKKGDWRIGTKSYETRFYSSPYGMGNPYSSPGFGSTYPIIAPQLDISAEKDLVIFKEMHPTSWKGEINDTASKFTEDNVVATDIASGIKKDITPEKIDEVKKEQQSVITNPEREVEIPNGLKETILHPENTRDEVDFDPSNPSIHNDPIALSLLYAFDRNYSKEFEKDPELKEKYTSFMLENTKYQDAVEKCKISIGTINKTPTSTSVVDNFTKSYDTIKESQRKILAKFTTFIDGKNKFTTDMGTLGTDISLLNYGADVSNEDTKKNVVAVIETIENLSSFFVGKSSSITQINVDMSKIQNDFIERKKRMQDAGEDPTFIILQNQLKQIKLGEDLKKFKDMEFDDQLQNLLEDLNNLKFVTITDSQKAELTNAVVKLTTDVEKTFTLVNRLYTNIKNEDYKYILTENGDITRSLYALKTHLDGLVIKYNKICTPHLKDGITVETIMNDSKKFIPVTQVLDKIKQTYSYLLDTFVKTLEYIENKNLMQTNMITKLYDFLSALSSKKKLEMDTLLKKPKKQLTEDDKHKIKTLDFIVHIISYDLRCYGALIDKDSTFTTGKNNSTVKINGYISSLQKENKDIVNTKELFTASYGLNYIFDNLLLKLDIYTIYISIEEFTLDTSYWTILKDVTTVCLEDTKKMVSTKINETSKIIKQYRINYNDSKRKILLEQVRITTTPIQELTPIMTKSRDAFDSYRSNRQQMKYYNEMVLNQAICFEWITIYAKLSHITLSRDVVFLSNERTNLLNSTKFSKDVILYYKNIIENVEIYNPSFPFWITAFWSMSLNGSVKEITPKIQTKLVDGNKLITENTTKLELNKMSLNSLEEKYINATNNIIPDISELGIVDTCKNILDETIVTDVVETRSSKFFNSLYSRKNEDNSDRVGDYINWIYGIGKDMKLLKKIGASKEYIFKLSLLWNAYDVLQPDENDSLIQSIAYALNGQLIVDGEVTLSSYSNIPKINGSVDYQKYNDFEFTLDSIKTAIGPAVQTTQLILDHLAGVFKIDIIVFDMYQDDTIKNGSYVTFEFESSRYFGYITDYISATDYKIISPNKDFLYEVNYVSDVHIIKEHLHIRNQTFTENNNFMFLLCDNKEAGKNVYQNIYENNINQPFVYKFESMPIYLKFSIFNDLIRFTNDITLFNFSKEMTTYLTDLKTGYDAIVPTQMTPRTSRSIRGGAIGDPEDVISQYKRPTDYRMDALYGSTNSKLSFYVIIDLDLYPGADGIPVAQQAVLACQNKYEKIRKAWAKIFGLVYRPIEMDVVGHVAPDTVKYKKKRDDETQKNRITGGGRSGKHTRRIQYY